MAKDIRLDKYIAEAAGITRKDAKSALQKGRVRVNGEVCKNGDVKELGAAMGKALSGRGGGKPGSWQGNLKATRAEIETFWNNR